MSTTDAPADPLVSSFAALLSVPLRELYALLWRAGVVEIVKPDPREYPTQVVADSLGPDFPERGSVPPPRRSRRQPTPGPEPTRPARSAYSRATG
ncbi:Rv1535 domain-containing protein [Mycobacterium sp. 1423905.2]|uniref:Rv1535 domain-containing protein n=1 Tax=Mycobacterium sp. 1423905.2 TaxID=1856859 RepID=UPI0020A2B4BB|nr:Rv1535 domain-containing protein [Mycobacterium sp. 1423905.2]